MKTRRTSTARSRPARAGAVAAVFSGLPSTIHALATGRSPLESVRAAGTLVARTDAPGAQLVAAGVVAHVAISMWWATVLGLLLPRRAPVAAGAAAGLAIAALDLGVVGRRVPRIAALPLAPQVADHVAFGALVALVLRRSAAERPGR
jgi:hypothetical protein